MILIGNTFYLIQILSDDICDSWHLSQCPSFSCLSIIFNFQDRQPTGHRRQLLCMCDNRATFYRQTYAII